MATFDEFYSSLDSDPGIRGKQFEKFVKWFLKNDPVWASQVEDIWLWDEHPKRSEWGPDCGIDLVFNDYQNKSWAVQAKCFAPQSSIKKEDMDSFISESSDSRFQGRLLVASTDRIGTNTDRLLNRHKVIRYLLNDFRNAQINFPESPKDFSKGKRKDLRKPRPHQLEAIDAVEEGLKTSDRGQVLMACGTGKTLTSLWIKERLEAEEVLVLLPSLSLLSQTLKEWNSAASKPFKWICVCSDKSVAKTDQTKDDWIKNTSEIGVPVTSEIEEINNFLDEKGSKVIFSTYQSSPLVSQAHKVNKEHNFDIIFADEAHRCAGRVSYAFGCVLDEVKIRSKKRLFFTATPRVLSNQIKAKADSNDIEIASMDNKLIFGNILYQLKFSDAIKRDLLSDYQVVIVGVDDSMLKEKIINRDLITIDGENIFDAETLASKIALTKAIKDFGLTRVITFHSRVKKAEKFAQDLKKVFKFISEKDLPEGQIQSDHVSGAMKTKERNDKIEKLKNLDKGEIRILANARCLSEGVDVPTLDGIGFIDPKSSQIDIIQAVGRAIRKNIDKKLGTIIIPIYVENVEEIDEKILTNKFSDIYKIILALKSQDDVLNDFIDQFRISIGENKKKIFNENYLEKIIFDLPEKITYRFAAKLRTLVIENTSSNWLEKFGELKSFFKKYKNYYPDSKNHLALNKWVDTQRNLYNKKLLIQERIDKLQEINFKWEREQEFIWKIKFDELKNYHKINGHSNPHFKNNDLGNWTRKQRQNYKNGILTKDKIELLESINFEWSFTNKWDQKYEALKNFYNKNGHTYVSSQNKEIGRWVVKQRGYYKTNKLNKRQIQLLNAIQFIWDIDKVAWDNNFEKLKEFIQKNDHQNLPRELQSLRNWCMKQRRDMKWGKLSNDKIKQLEEINFIWDVNEERWNKQFNELKNYYKINGHSKPPYKKGCKFFKFADIQRQYYRNQKLSQEKIKLLNEIEFVWDPLVHEWNEKFNELKNYYKNNGHSSPLTTDPSLGNWVSVQRKMFKESKLSNDKIKKLKEINFIWAKD